MAAWPSNRRESSCGRHESFPLRFGWIAKGLEAVCNDPTVFVQENATVRLGVGKNMVLASRHWLRAARLVRPSASGGYTETEVGRVAFGEDGDPYLEDDATIWLVHWPLAGLPRRIGILGERAGESALDYLSDFVEITCDPPPR